MILPMLYRYALPMKAEINGSLFVICNLLFHREVTIVLCSGMLLQKNHAAPRAVSTT